VPGDDPEVARLKADLHIALAKPDLKRADMLLAAVQAAQDRDIENRALQAAATCAQRGELARTQLRYYEAAAHFAAAAAARAPTSAETERISYLDQQAVTLYAQGEQFGNNAALIAALEIIRFLANLLPRDRAALEWAKTQHNLGVVFWRLAEHDEGTAYLEKAIAVFHSALEVRTRELVPLEWAETQNNLGAALQTLGARESRSLRLEEAVAAYDAALTEYSREQVPLKWAQTQNNLGAALTRLGGRLHAIGGQGEMVAAIWGKAMAAYDAALQLRTREQTPLVGTNTEQSWEFALSNG
jgi:tetratricopeptide (TPR) repeat protein